MLSNSMIRKNNDVDYLVMEFFAGLGGFATAWPEVRVAAAVDIHQEAAQIYAANHPHPFWIREIESIALDELVSLKANLWWMSPPCQPYTFRGKRRDIDDPRARSLFQLISLIADCQPEYILLENVLGFAQSIAFELLTQQLGRCGYRWQALELCPTAMGWPNRRPRFYLVASRSAQVSPWRELPSYNLSTAEMVDWQGEACDAASDLHMDAATLATIEAGIDRWDGNNERATACFGSSYGRSLLNSGSYLQLPSGGYRRFSPREVASFLGFPQRFDLRPALRTRTLWKLLGNSLSLPAVRYVLSHLPNGPSPNLPWLV
jgi:DNA (cytosine-5)-methyltransferase 1